MTPAQIKALRLRLGASQEEFAGMLDVTSSAVSRWERGERKPGRFSIHQMRALSKDLHELDVEEAITDATLDEISKAAGDAVNHAQKNTDSPLIWHLAGDAATSHAFGDKAEDWILSKQHLGREKVSAVVSELMRLGLWPWA